MYVASLSTVTSAAPVLVITGAVVSTTFTVLVTSVAEFSFASSTLYVTVYDPNSESAFTLFTVTISFV